MLNFITYSLIIHCIAASIPQLSSTRSFAVSKTQLSAIWHIRLRHATHAVLNKIDSIFPAISYQCNKLCSICPVAKQCKLPFSASISHTTSNFELLHTQHGCRYFLTIVYDHSRGTSTFLMVTKQHIPDFNKCFCLCQELVLYYN